MMMKITKPRLMALLVISTLFVQNANAQLKKDTTSLKAKTIPVTTKPVTRARLAVPDSLLNLPVRGTVKDIDGNTYNTLQIGNQVWMLENLRTTRLNDNTPIVNPNQVLVSKNYFGLQPSSFPNGGWNVNVADPDHPGQYVLKATDPAYCYYNNLPANITQYGNLYNWYAVSSGKLAPEGWHVATDADWDILFRYVADSANSSLPYFNSGGNLKAIGGWNSPNTGATNKSGFTAVGGGHRSSATFSGLGDAAYFWSSTPRGPGDSGAKVLGKSNSGVSVVSSNNLLMGCSVRCVKNNP